MSKVKVILHGGETKAQRAALKYYAAKIASWSEPGKCVKLQGFATRPNIINGVYIVSNAPFTPDSPAILLRGDQAAALCDSDLGAASAPNFLCHKIEHESV